VLPVRRQAGRTGIGSHGGADFTLVPGETFMAKPKLSALGALVCLAAAALAAATAQASDERTLAAIDAATGWLALVEAGKAEESYAAAGADFRSTVSAEDWARVVESRREQLGSVRVRKATKVNYFPAPEGATSGDWVMIRFVTGFERRDQVSETVTVVSYPEDWGISGYYIR